MTSAQDPFHDVLLSRTGQRRSAFRAALLLVHPRWLRAPPESHLFLIHEIILHEGSTCGGELQAVKKGNHSAEELCSSVEAMRRHSIYPAVATCPLPRFDHLY